MAPMAISKTMKSLIRSDVALAVQQLRKRLKITQEELAEMVGSKLVGSKIRMITVSRWERGEEMPYPKNREKLAEIALGRGWLDIAGALDVRFSFDEWLSVVEENAPETYRLMMSAGMCASNCFMFDPEDPNDPSEEEFRIIRKKQELMKIAEELLAHLAKIQAGGKDVIAPPPNAHYRRFWYDTLERRTSSGKAKKVSR